MLIFLTQKVKVILVSIFFHIIQSFYYTSEISHKAATLLNKQIQITY